MSIQEKLSMYFSSDRIDIVLNSKNFEKLGDRVPKGQFEAVVNLDLCRELYEDYQLPLYKIAMLYGVSDVTLREYLIKIGTNIVGHRCGMDRKCAYFDTIDSFDKAYFLGLIMADGCITVKNFNVSLQLNHEDGYIIHKFKKYAKLNNKVREYSRVKNNEKVEHYDKISICSEKMFQDLIRLGVTPNKSKLGTAKLPDINIDLISHFIRGYFDGNGIAFSDGKIGYCGSEGILLSIRETLINRCEASNVQVTYNKSNHIYYLTWSAKQSVKNICDYMYNNCQDLYLSRKRSKIDSKL